MSETMPMPELSQTPIGGEKDNALPETETLKDSDDEAQKDVKKEDSILLSKNGQMEPEHGSLRFYPARKISRRKAEWAGLDPDKDKKEQVREKIRQAKQDAIDNRKFGEDKKRPEELKHSIYLERVAEDERDRKKEAWLVEELEEDMRDIIKYADSIGVKLTRENFPLMDDIYVRKEPMECDDESRVVGTAPTNEMEFMDFPDELQRRQIEVHELVHNSSRKKIVVDVDGPTTVSSGLHNDNSVYIYNKKNADKNGDFRYLNEALTELTARKVITARLGRCNNGSYDMPVEFVKALVRDMTEKLNGKDKAACAKEDIVASEFFGKKLALRKESGLGEKSRHHLEKMRAGLADASVRTFASILSKATGIPLQVKTKKVEWSPRLSPQESFTEEEIMGYFQAGMFNGDRRCLKIVRDIYGEDALKGLSRMEKMNRRNIQELAHTFGLEDLEKKFSM